MRVCVQNNKPLKHHSAHVKHYEHYGAYNIGMEFKDILRELREEKGLTQAQLAEQLHFSLSIVNKWENGKKNPSVEAVKILAKFFNVTTDYILNMDN